MAYYTNRQGQLSSTYGLVGDNYEEKEREGHQSEMARQQQSSASYDAAAANKSAEARATAAAEAQKYSADQQRIAAIEAARLRSGNYKNGGPVIKSEFKHANPTYTKYGQTGDSSLLAKGKR